MVLGKRSYEEYLTSVRAVTILVPSYADGGPGGHVSLGSMFKPLGIRHEDFRLTVNLSVESVLQMDSRCGRMLAIMCYRKHTIEHVEDG